jgi:hypothetical protein
MPPRGQDPAQTAQRAARRSAQRATAARLRRGEPTLPPSITKPVRAAQSRAQLERVFGDLPFSKSNPNVRVRDRDDYNAQAVAHRLGKTDSGSQQQVLDAEYWDDLEYEGEDDDDPFWYH